MNAALRSVPGGAGEPLIREHAQRLFGATDPAEVHEIDEEIADPAFERIERELGERAATESGRAVDLGHRAHRAQVNILRNGGLVSVLGYRIGGDEFAVILPDCRAWGALEFVQRLQLLQLELPGFGATAGGQAPAPGARDLHARDALRRAGGRRRAPHAHAVHRAGCQGLLHPQPPPDGVAAHRADRRRAGLPEEARWVRHHHERVDGRGYPDRHGGEDIPLESRIILVADAFAAMTSDRPYRTAPGLQFAVAELQRGAGTQFDADVVDALCRALATAEQEISKLAA